MATRKTAKKGATVRKNSRSAASKRTAAGVASRKGVKKAKAAVKTPERAKVLRSKVVFKGRLFRVLRDDILEPTGLRSTRDVIRHNGSAVILAVDRSSSKKNPWVVMERQRELAEETGYRARKWRPLVSYYASPGFLGEAMQVFLAEDLYAGEATPEEDERIEIRLVKLSDILRMIEKGAIHDGKTLNAVLLYAWILGRKRKK